MDMSRITTVTTTQGHITGNGKYRNISPAPAPGKDQNVILLTNYISYTGIPYARPPVGDLRFKDPEPLKPLNEEDFPPRARDCVWPSKKCIQLDGNGKWIGGEDCLYLNVHTPRINTDELFPVIFYIHGGAFQMGSGNVEDMGPDYLMPHDVVFVTCNYRLNVFGFLNLGIPEAPGNVGLKDQIMALKWVQDNIENFGGDKFNVTLLGLSAGAMAVEAHLLSPCTKGLFHKAIIQSGSSLSHWGFQKDYQVYIDRMLKKLDYEGSPEEPYKVLEFLKSLDTQTLAEATVDLLQDEDYRNNYLMPFFPTISKIPNYENFLTQHPNELLKAGKYRKVPTISGIVDKEGLIIPPAYYSKDTLKQLNEGDFEQILPNWIKGDRKEIGKLASEIYGAKDNVKIVDYLGDVSFNAGVWKSLEYRVGNGDECFYYLFSYDGGINFIKKKLNIKEKGTCHGDDLTYLGPNSQIPEKCFATKEDKDMIKKFTALWTDFAKYGHPTPKPQKNGITWHPITNNNRFIRFEGKPEYKFNCLNINSKLTLESENRFQERSSFWSKILH